MNPGEQTSLGGRNHQRGLHHHLFSIADSLTMEAERDVATDMRSTDAAAFAPTFGVRHSEQCAPPIPRKRVPPSEHKAPTQERESSNKQATRDDMRATIGPDEINHVRRLS